MDIEELTEEERKHLRDLVKREEKKLPSMSGADKKLALGFSVVVIAIAFAMLAWNDAETLIGKGVEFIHHAAISTMKLIVALVLAHTALVVIDTPWFGLKGHNYDPRTRIGTDQEREGDTVAAALMSVSRYGVLAALVILVMLAG